MVSTVNNTSSTSTGTGTTALTSAQAQTDRFLKLLVAQLNNQDPMNPMDNAQMTSQMAQISTVTGIETLSGLFSESEDARVPRKWAFGKFEGSSISSADRGYARWFVNTCKDRSDYQYYVVALKRGGLL